MSEGTKAEDGDVREEYDFTNARKNPYAKLARAGVKIALIEPELFAHFPSSEAINAALRGLVKSAEKVS